jgi:hypothetical protein
MYCLRCRYEGVALTDETITTTMCERKAEDEDGELMS